MPAKWWTWEPEEYRRQRDARAFGKWAEEEEDPSIPMWRRNGDLDKAKVPPVGPRAAQWFKNSSEKQLGDWRKDILRSISKDGNEPRFPMPLSSLESQSPAPYPPPPPPEMPPGGERPDWQKSLLQGIGQGTEEPPELYRYNRSGAAPQAPQYQPSAFALKHPWEGTRELAGQAGQAIGAGLGQAGETLGRMPEPTPPTFEQGLPLVTEEQLKTGMPSWIPEGIATSLARGTAEATKGYQPTETTPKFLQAGLAETTPSLIARAGMIDKEAQESAIQLPPDWENANALEKAGAIVISFVADPITYMSFGLGGLAAKGATKLISTKLAREYLKAGAGLIARGVTPPTIEFVPNLLGKVMGRLVPGAVGGATGLGLYEAVRSAPVQQVATGKVDPLQVAIDTLRGGALGGTLGAVGKVAEPFGKVAQLGAETVALGMAPGVMERRAPTVEDFILGAGMVLGLKAPRAIGNALFKLVRGSTNLMPGEVAAVRDVSPEQRANIIDQVYNKAADTWVNPKTAGQRATDLVQKVAGIRPGFTVEDVSGRSAAIDAQLAKLQARYEKMMVEPQGARPPGIQKDRLAGIAKQMDKLDAEKARLAGQAAERPVDAAEPITPLDKASEAVIAAAKLEGIDETQLRQAADRLATLDGQRSPNTGIVAEAAQYLSPGAADWIKRAARDAPQSASAQDRLMRFRVVQGQAEGLWAYHRTSKTSLPAMFQEGMTTGDFTAGAAIDFPGDVTVRVRLGDIPSPQIGEYGKGVKWYLPSYETGGAISPDKIEVQVGRRWIPLREHPEVAPVAEEAAPPAPEEPAKEPVADAAPAPEEGIPAAVLAVHTYLSEMKAHNSAIAGRKLDNLAAQGFFVDDARDSLQDYRDIDRSEFEDASDYKDARDEAWGEFLDAVEGIEPIEAEAEPVTPVKEPVVEATVAKPKAPYEAKVEDIDAIIEEAGRETAREGTTDLALGLRVEQLALKKEAEQPTDETWAEKLAERVEPEKLALKDEAEQRRRTDWEEWIAAREKEAAEVQEKAKTLRAVTIAEIGRKARGPTVEERTAMPRNTEKAIFVVDEYDEAVKRVVEQFQQIPETTIGGGAGNIPLYRLTPMQRAFEVTQKVPGLAQVAHYIDPVASALGAAKQDNPIAWVHAKRDLFVGQQGNGAREAVAEWVARNRKLLGINSDGLATAVKVKAVSAAMMPKGAAHRLDDIMENFKSYDITPEQRAAFTEIEHTFAAILQAQLNEGMDVHEAKNYWGRIVTKTPKGAEVVATTRGHEKARAFEYVRDGLRKGYEFADSVTALTERLVHGVETIANKRMSEEIKDLGKTKAERFKESPKGQAVIAEWKLALNEYKKAVALQGKGMATAAEVRASERGLSQAIKTLRSQKELIGRAHPSAGEVEDYWTGRIYPQEIAEQLNKWKPGDPNLLDEYFGLERASMVVGDWSQILVQGTNTFFAHNPTWWKALAYSIASTAKAPEGYRVANSAAIRSGIDAMAITPPTEFLLSSGGKIMKTIGKLPLVKQTQRAFEWWTFVAQTELWKAYNGQQLTGLARAETATHIRKATGVLLRVGLTTKEKAIDTRMLFAARFAGATTTMMTDTLRGGVRGAEARKQMGAIIAGGVALTTALQWLINRTLPNWDDPDKKDWGSIDTPAGTISVFGPYHTYFRAFAQMSADVAKGKPGKALAAASVLARGKASLRAGPLIDFIMGETPTGFPVTTGARGLLDAYVLRVGPIGPRQVAEHIVKVREGKNIPMPAVVGEVFGLRTSPYTTAQRLRRLKDSLAETTYGKEWADINGIQQDELNVRNPQIAQLEEDTRKEAAIRESEQPTITRAPSGGGSSQERREAAEAVMGKGATSETAQAWSTARPELDKMKDMQIALDRQLDVTRKISGNEWRGQYHNLQATKRGVLIGIGLAFPKAAMTGAESLKYKEAMATIAGTVPDRRARAEILADMYMAMTPEKDEDGLDDMEGFFEQRKVFREALSPEDMAGMLAQVSKSSTPTVKRYYEAAELMNQYYEFPRYQGMSKEMGEEAYLAAKQVRAIVGTMNPQRSNRTQAALQVLRREEGPGVASLAQRALAAKAHPARVRFRFQNQELLNRFYSDLLRAEQQPVETELVEGRTGELVGAGAK